MPSNKELYKLRDSVKETLTVKRQHEILKFQYPLAQLTKLVGREDWDCFRSLIQGLINDFEQSLENAQNALNDPRVLGRDSLITAKSTYLVVKSQLDILYVILDLPQAFIEDVKKAEKILLDVKPGVTENPPNSGE